MDPFCTSKTKLLRGEFTISSVPEPHGSLGEHVPSLSFALSNEPQHHYVHSCRRRGREDHGSEDPKGCDPSGACNVCLFVHINVLIYRIVVLPYIFAAAVFLLYWPVCHVLAYCYSVSAARVAQSDRASDS